jgi:predicted phage tail protein
MSGGPIVANLSVAGTTVTVPNVPPGTYFVRVRALNAEGTSGPSNEEVVQVGTGCQAAPNPPGGLVATESGSNVTLNWSPPAGGCPPTTYVINAGLAPGGLPRVASIPVGLNTTFSGTGPPGTYYVTVAAANAFGTSGPSNEERVDLGCTPPGTPTAFSSNVTGNTVLFSWGPPTTGGAATSYLLEVGRLSGATDFRFSLNATTFSATGAPNGTFFARVMAVNACGTGDASEEKTLVIPGACLPLGATSTPTTTVSGSNVTISWNAVNGAAKYRVDVGTAMGASNVTSQEVTGTSHQLTALNVGTYFTRVTAIDGCGDAGPTSGEATFRIDAPPPTVQSVAVNGPATIEVGQAAQFTATAMFSNGSSSNVTSTSNWSSSNNAVAVVTGGLVDALSAGTADIRATFQGVTGARGVQVTQTVIPPPQAIISLSHPRDLPEVNEDGGQCAATRASRGGNFLQCNFEGGRSTPLGRISSYEWSFSGGGPTLSGDSTISGDDINYICGSFGDANDGLAAEIDVTLTVTAGGRSDSEVLKVTIIKVGAC